MIEIADRYHIGGCRSVLELFRIGAVPVPRIASGATVNAAPLSMRWITREAHGRRIAAREVKNQSQHNVNKSLGQASEEVVVAVVEGDKSGGLPYRLRPLELPQPAISGTTGTTLGAGPLENGSPGAYF